MEWNAQKVLVNVRKADVDDLIDRITAYRAGMEPEAVEMIENELHRRGVSDAEIETRRQQYLAESLFHADGSAKVCSLCRKPAVREAWGWHRLFGKIPLLPCWFRYCKQHGGESTSEAHRHPPG